MSKYVLIGPLIVILVWIIVSFFKLANPLFLPPFFDTIDILFLMLKSGSVFLDLWATLYRTLIGFSIAIILGVPFGLLVGNYLKLYKSFEVVIDFFRSLPGTALFLLLSCQNPA